MKKTRDIDAEIKLVNRLQDQEKAGGKTKMYAAKHNGKRVRVTIPENDASNLFDAIREQLSPKAVAAIAAYLQPVSTKDSAVNKEVTWFYNQLIEMLGAEEFNALCEEVGL